MSDKIVNQREHVAYIARINHDEGYRKAKAEIITELKDLCSYTVDDSHIPFDEEVVMDEDIQNLIERLENE